MTPMVVERTEWHDVDSSPIEYEPVWLRTVDDDIFVGMAVDRDLFFSLIDLVYIDNDDGEITHWTELKVPRFE